MRTFLSLLVLTVALPLGSCNYFWYFGYPKEVQRESNGDLSVVALASPTARASPSLVFGSLHNNTTISVSLARGGKTVATSVLLSGEDMPHYHLPLSVQWGGNSVTVREPHYGKHLVLRVPGGT